MTDRDRFEEDGATALKASEPPSLSSSSFFCETPVFLPATDSPPPWWLAFLYLFRHIGSQFAKHLAVLKKMRRARPMPKDWRAFYPMLREAEWPIHVLMTEGARQLLADKRLDLHAVPFDPDPPSTFQPAFPRSALAMHQRIEATARFNANPELYVRRHAARIRARAAAANLHRLVQSLVAALMVSSDPDKVRIAPVEPRGRLAPLVDQRVRAPP